MIHTTRNPWRRPPTNTERRRIAAARAAARRYEDQIGDDDDIAPLDPDRLGADEDPSVSRAAEAELWEPEPLWRWIAEVLFEFVKIVTVMGSYVVAAPSLLAFLVNWGVDGWAHAYANRFTAWAWIAGFVLHLTFGTIFLVWRFLHRRLWGFWIGETLLGTILVGPHVSGWIMKLAVISWEYLLTGKWDFLRSFPVPLDDVWKQYVPTLATDEVTRGFRLDIGNYRLGQRLFYPSLGVGLGLMVVYYVGRAVLTISKKRVEAKKLKKQQNKRI